MNDASGTFWRMLHVRSRIDRLGAACSKGLVLPGDVKVMYFGAPPGVTGDVLNVPRKDRSDMQGSGTFNRCKTEEGTSLRKHGAADRTLGVRSSDDDLFLGNSNRLTQEKERVLEVLDHLDRHEDIKLIIGEREHLVGVCAEIGRRRGNKGLDVAVGTNDVVVVTRPFVTTAA